MAEDKSSAFTKVLLAGLGLYVADKVLPIVLKWLSSLELSSPPEPPRPAGLPPPSPPPVPEVSLPPVASPSEFKLFDLEALVKSIAPRGTGQDTNLLKLVVPPLPPDHELAEIIDVPGVILICGHRGSGKTALVFRLQEFGARARRALRDGPAGRSQTPTTGLVRPCQ